MNLGTVAYALSAGASIGIGVVFLIMSVRRGRPRPVDLSVGCFGVLAGVQTIVTLQMQSSQDIAGYSVIMKGSFSLSSLAVLIAAIWVVAATTKVGWPHVPAALTVAAIGLGFVTLLSEGGLIIQSVSELRDVSLFGEPFVVHVANTSSLRFLLDGFLLALTIYFLSALVVNYRRVDARQSALLIGVVFVFLFGLYDTLVDEAVVNTPYLAPLGYVAFVLGAAIQHTKHLRKNERALSEYNANLEDLVAVRTKTLDDTNSRLLDELTRRERTVLNLTELTRQSIALDNLGVDEVGEIQPGMNDVVAALTHIIGAGSVNLQLTPSVASSLGNLEIDQQGLNVWSSAWREEDEELEYPLRSGDVALGRLIVRARPGESLSKIQRQLASLSAELVTAALRRFRLEAGHVVSVVDEERRRIAQDLHDSLLQRLYAAAFQADALDSGAGQESQEFATQAHTIRDLVLSSIAEMRTLIFELQPETFELTSLTGLIEQLCESMGEIYGYGIACQSSPGPLVPPEPKLALYRITQEALANSLRHAEAQNISVSIEICDEAVSLAVTDDGIGFDLNDLTAGNGLRNLTARATQIGATMEITSAPGAGTSISAAWLRHQPVGSSIDLTDSASAELAKKDSPEVSGRERKAHTSR